MKFSGTDDAYPVTALLLLKALVDESVPLERLALIDGSNDNLNVWRPSSDFSDSLVDFFTKMSHLTCCCITFSQMDVDLMNGIKNRVEEEVVKKRRWLWFHLGRAVPKASDAGVPPIHYHEMVEPVTFLMPLIMDAPEAGKAQLSESSKCASSCSTCWSTLAMAINGRGKV